MNKKLLAIMNEHADKIQERIDAIDDPESMFHRPAGTWRSNYEDGWMECYEQLKPVIEALRKCHGAMGYAYDDNPDKYFCNVQDMINEALRKAGILDEPKEEK